MLTSPSKFLTGTIFLHAHLQAVYYNYVKFHLNPMSRLGGVIPEWNKILIDIFTSGYLQYKNYSKIYN
jgi:hypothetical protein